MLAGPPGQGLDPAVSDAGAATTALASAALVLGALAGGGAEPDGAAAPPGLLGDIASGAAPETDPAGTAGVLVLALDRATAARVAAAEGRPLTVAMTSGP